MIDEFCSQKKVFRKNNVNIIPIPPRIFSARYDAPPSPTCEAGTRPASIGENVYIPKKWVAFWAGDPFSFFLNEESRKKRRPDPDKENHADRNRKSPDQNGRDSLRESTADPDNRNRNENVDEDKPE